MAEHLDNRIKPPAMTGVSRHQDSGSRQWLAHDQDGRGHKPGTTMNKATNDLVMKEGKLLLPIVEL